MIKRVGCYSLKEGTDKEAFWKYHTQEHAAHIKELGGPGLKKYVINRVLKTAYGEQPFFTLTEQVFENEELQSKYVEAMKTTKLPSGKTAMDIWDSQEALVHLFRFFAEEFMVKDPGTKIYATRDNEVVKRVFTTSLKEGTDEDTFWKYWTEEHAPHIVEASSPGLKKYVLSRVTKVRQGEQLFFAVMEMWFENEEAMNKDIEASKTIKLPSGLSIFDDFLSRVVGSWAGIVEEFVVK